MGAAGVHVVCERQARGRWAQVREDAEAAGLPMQVVADAESTPAQRKLLSHSDFGFQFCSLVDTVVSCSSAGCTRSGVDGLGGKANSRHDRKPSLEPLIRLEVPLLQDERNLLGMLRTFEKREVWRCCQHTQACH
jgi:hypothetical protein